MDAFNLKTASTYLNNLLLARGLLRNGAPIDFARPSKSPGGLDNTMAQIINLVHDLVLRQDRDLDTRENLAETLRKLRTDQARLTQSLERNKTLQADTERQLSLSQAQEKSARAAARTAESTIKTLKEETVRLRAQVAQVRAACANDVRKRDVQIQRLKTHLAGQQRGAGKVGGGLVISPGSALPAQGLKGDDADGGAGVEDPEYSLRMETTEFLTRLSQSLSDENDGLIGIVKGALGTLRELQGLPEQGQKEREEDGEGLVQAVPSSYQALAEDMEVVLENLRSILTTPNFVPVEEVAVREEEIMKLRLGWEKMEGKWREALALMDGWAKRMVNGGDTVNLEEIRVGLGLGRELDLDETIESIRNDESHVSLGSDAVTADEVTQDLYELDLSRANVSSPFDTRPVTRTIVQPRPLIPSAGNIKSPRKVSFKKGSTPQGNGTLHADENQDEPTHPATDDTTASEVDLLPASTKSITRRHAAEAPTKRASMSNIKSQTRSTRSTTTSTTRKVFAFAHSPGNSSTIGPPPQRTLAASEATCSPTNRTHGPADAVQALRRLSTPKGPRSQGSRGAARLARKEPRASRKERLSDDEAEVEPEEDGLDMESPHLTVQEKLNVAQAEAEAAAAAAGLDVDAVMVRMDEAEYGENEHVSKSASTRDGARVPTTGSTATKRTRIKGRARRRKSTLTPDELQLLMMS